MIIAVCNLCDKALTGPPPVRQVQGQPPPKQEPRSSYCSKVCEELDAKVQKRKELARKYNAKCGGL